MKLGFVTVVSSVMRTGVEVGVRLVAPRFEVVR